MHYETGTINLKSENMYNDGKWHNVAFKKMKQIGELSIDGEVINEAQAKDLQNPITLNAPYFYGGLLNVTPEIKKHLEVSSFILFELFLYLIKLYVVFVYFRVIIRLSKDV